jgi:hypothetical protein
MGETALRFGMGVSSEGCCLAPCAGCVLLITFRKCAGLLYRRAPYSVVHIGRPSSAEHNILSAEEETPEQLGARLYLMSGDMGDHPSMIALPPGPRARGRSPPVTAIVYTHISRCRFLPLTATVVGVCIGGSSPRSALPETVDSSPHLTDTSNSYQL